MVSEVTVVRRINIASWAAALAAGKAYRGSVLTSSRDRLAAECMKPVR
jgi:hypothetical protein